MGNKQLMLEQKKLDLDLNVIGIVTFIAFGLYAAYGGQMKEIVTNDAIPVLLRVLLAAVIQFGIAGFGIVMVMLLRRERFYEYGLQKKQALKSVVGTFLCFLPSIIYIIASGNFHGYHPLKIFMTDDVLSSGFPINILGMGLIFIVWGFFEGINYAVISDKINKRYPAKSFWLNYGAITCALICLLFHPIHTDFWGIVELLTTFFAIYGMLLIKTKTGNAWGCVFAFTFIWNAL